MDDEAATPAPASGAGIEVVRSEEHVVSSTRRVVRGRVRVSKRVRVEERTVTVQVRCEELVVEHLPPEQPDREASASPANAPVLELILSEEQVEVTTRAVPQERVRVFVDTVADTAAVDTTVAREVIDLTTQSETV